MRMYHVGFTNTVEDRCDVDRLLLSVDRFRSAQSFTACAGLGWRCPGEFELLVCLVGWEGEEQGYLY